MVDPTDARPVPRWGGYLSSGLAVLLAATGLTVVFVVAGSDPWHLDVVWNDLVGMIPEWVHAGAHALNVVGGGVIATWVIPLAGALLLILVRRYWGALYFLLAVALSAGTIQLVKSIVARERPPDMLVTSDFGSFPSGHTANAATLAVAVIVLWPRLWVILAGAAWTVAMAFSRTLLHAHWATDTLGGMLFGVAVALLLAAAMSVPLARERARIAARQENSEEREPDGGPG